MNQRLDDLFKSYQENRISNQELKEFFLLLEDSSHDQQSQQILDAFYDEDVNVPLTADRKSSLYDNIIKHNKIRTKTTRIWFFSRYAAAVLIFTITAFFLVRRAGDSVTVIQEAQQAKNAKRYITLPDSSIVVLNKNANITFADDFGKSNRVIKLQGEAYFHVKKDPDHPFIVETSSGISTKVLGTKFNVKTSENGDVTITVSEGRVQVAANQRIVRVLKANEQLQYTLNTKNFSEKRVDASKIVSWQNKDLYFNDSDLSQVLQKLEEKYRVQIKLRDVQFANEKVSATFMKDESLEEVLNVICAFLDLSYQSNKNGYVIIYKK